MPAATVIVKQQQQQPQQQTTKQVFNKCARMRRSGVVADVAAKSNKSNAVDVGAAAVPRTPIAAAPSTARRRKRQQSTDKAARGLVIIIALVLNIMQNQQQQVILHYWPFCNVAFATHTSNNNSHSSSYNSVGLKVISEDVLQPLSSFSSTSSSSTSTAVAAEMPQTEATNNTFKSLAFLASDASEDDSFAYSLKTDVFAEMELAQSLPIFDFGMPRNITGRTGHSEALIKCRVDKLYDKSVSWIRKRDLHILTVGTATYTNDKRFQVTESKDMRDWTLHVKSPQAKDSGIYECQVNTEPKISMAFQLNIVEISPDARAVISGPPDLHFKAGSAIVLSCVVKQPSSKDIGPIYWYRGEQLITPLEEDDGEVETPKELQLGQLNQSLNEVLSTDLQKEFTTRIAMESQLGDTLKSRLRISNAQITDTGIYTCQPTTANSASVVVHVIDDENPAAMQKSTATSCFHKDLQQFLVRILWTIILAIHSTKNWLPKVSTCNYVEAPAPFNTCIE